MLFNITWTIKTKDFSSKMSLCKIKSYFKTKTDDQVSLKDEMFMKVTENLVKLVFIYFLLFKLNQIQLTQIKANLKKNLNLI